MRLLVVGAGERGEHERVARHAAAGHPPGLGERDHLREHVLHREGGPYLDEHAGLVVPGVGERVRHAARDHDHVAGPGDHAAQPEPELHAPGHDLEALLLHGMDVRERDRAARTQAQLEGERLSAGRRGGLTEGEALAGHGVLEGLSWL